MKLSNLNEWLTLAANVGVLAGIIFLAVEISQNTSTLRSQTLQNRTDNLIDVNSYAIDQVVLASALEKLNWVHHTCLPNLELVESLPPGEVIAIRYWLYLQALRTQNLIQQVETGSLEREYYDTTIRGLINAFSPWWELFPTPVGRQLSNLDDRLNIDRQRRESNYCSD